MAHVLYGKALPERAFFQPEVISCVQFVSSFILVCEDKINYMIMNNLNSKEVTGWY